MKNFLLGVAASIIFGPAVRAGLERAIEKLKEHNDRLAAEAK
jgi:hypothetical protein